MKILAYLLLVAALCGLTGRAVGQTLHTLEYFIDTDPGVGLATPVDFTAANTAAIAYDLDITPAALAPLSRGLHRVGVRAKDSDGKWCVTSVHLFYYDGQASGRELHTVEYFIDTDPGVGLATPVDFTAAHTAAIAYDLDLTPAALAPLSRGLHQVGVRAKDSEGKWCASSIHLFYYDGINVIPEITSFAWRITRAGGFDSGLQTTQAAPPGTTVSMNFDALVPGLLKNEIHTITVQAVDSNGQASAPASLTALVSTPDSDNDGLPDAWEVTHFTNITTVNGTNDTDRDGIREFGEYAFGLNPKSGDLTALPPPTQTDGLVTLSVSKQPFVSYIVETSTDLDAGTWSTTGLTTVTDIPATLIVRETVKDARRFFRVRAVAAP